MNTVDRRSFMQLGGAAAISTLSKNSYSATKSNDTIRIAVLGVNGRGKKHIAGFHNIPGTSVAVLCDPDEKLLAERASEFSSKYGREVETEVDLRKVFERKDIDAVSIAMPNH